LGEGEHELIIAHTHGAVYVDGFRIVSNGTGDDAGTNEAAVQSRSVTEHFSVNAPGSLLGVLPTLVEKTIDLEARDLLISVEVESGEDLSVVLLNPLGQIVGNAFELLTGSDQSLYVLDAPVTVGGTYVLSISSLSGLSGSYPVSVARTVPVNQ
jgi:hypothetical protein